jgi:thiamine-phosphate pyrophosphorylase
MAITPGTSGNRPSDDRLAWRCGELATDGVDWLLVREKHLADGELIALARRIVATVAGSRTRVLVAAKPAAALASGADGVHVGSDLTRVSEARRVFPEAYVSYSCHSIADVLAARQAGVDLILFAPVFGKTVDGVEVVPGMGITALHEACVTVGNSLPVFALGGVTAENAVECVGAGASGVAAIRWFFAE